MNNLLIRPIFFYLSLYVILATVISSSYLSAEKQNLNKTLYSYNYPTLPLGYYLFKDEKNNYSFLAPDGMFTITNSTRQNIINEAWFHKENPSKINTNSIITSEYFELVPPIYYNK